MPFARIEIEQHQQNLWHAEIEAGGLAGGPNFRRVAFDATSYAEIVSKVSETYRSLLPVAPVPIAGMGPMTRDEDAQRREEVAKDLAVRHTAFVGEAEGATLRMLRVTAGQLGINFDGRWGAARLREAIAVAQGKG